MVIGLLPASVYATLIIGTTTDVALMSSPPPRRCQFDTPVPIAGFYIATHRGAVRTPGLKAAHRAAVAPIRICRQRGGRIAKKACRALYVIPVPTGSMKS